MPGLNGPDGPAGDGKLRFPFGYAEPRRNVSCGRVGLYGHRITMNLEKQAEYVLQERGYECEVRSRIFIFKRTLNPDDLEQSLDECFGDGRKVYAMTTATLCTMSIGQLISKLDEAFG